MFLPETRDISIPAKSSSFLKDIKMLSLSEKRLPLLFVTTFLFTFGWAFYISVIPVWWVQGLHSSQAEISLLFSGATCVHVLTCLFLVAPLIHRFAPINILSTAILLLAIALLASCILGNSLSTYWILLPLQNIFIALLLPITATIISDLSPRDHQGKSMGIFSACEALGYGLAPIMAGICLGVHLLLPTVVGSAFLIASYFLLRKIHYSKT
jgi:predicted MFS family arabinose efflux permease